MGTAKMLGYEIRKTLSEENRKSLEERLRTRGDEVSHEAANEICKLGQIVDELKKRNAKVERFLKSRWGA